MDMLKPRDIKNILNDIIYIYFYKFCEFWYTIGYGISLGRSWILIWSFSSVSLLNRVLWGKNLFVRKKRKYAWRSIVLYSSWRLFSKVSLTFRFRICSWSHLSSLLHRTLWLELLPFPSRSSCWRGFWVDKKMHRRLRRTWTVHTLNSCSPTFS